MSGGRHKKEIKRRTKTGCLTCRKRRIKVLPIPAEIPPILFLPFFYSLDKPPEQFPLERVYPGNDIYI